LFHKKAYVSLKHEGDKVIVYERSGLLFIFNFHPTTSFTDYRVGVHEAGEYRIVLTSDEKKFGGFDNVTLGNKFTTTPMEWHGRKNWLQVGLHPDQFRDVPQINYRFTYHRGLAWYWGNKIAGLLNGVTTLECCSRKR
jgi:hypothetical protein